MLSLPKLDPNILQPFPPRPNPGHPLEHVSGRLARLTVLSWQHCTVRYTTTSGNDASLGEQQQQQHSGQWSSQHSASGTAGWGHSLLVSEPCTSLVPGI